MAVGPLVVVAIIGGGILAALAAGKRKRKEKAAAEPAGEQPPTQAEVDAAYRAAIDPRQTNVDQMQYTANWLRKWGHADLADAVLLRVKELKEGRSAGPPYTIPSADVPPVDTSVRPTAAEIEQTIRAALDPRATNITQLLYWENWLRTWGRNDAADAVRIRVEELTGARARPAAATSQPAPAPTSTTPTGAGGGATPAPVTQQPVPAPVSPVSPVVTQQPVPAPPSPVSDIATRTPGVWEQPKPVEEEDEIEVTEEGEEEPPPIAKEETSSDVDTTGSTTLARVLIAREATPGWKTDLQPEVRAWQTANSPPLGVDGKFGPNSAVYMATHVGVLPTIRYWSGWDKATELAKYRARINMVADEIEPTNPLHAAALRISAQREQAEGWPKTTAQPIPKATRDAEAVQLANALKQATEQGISAAQYVKDRTTQIARAIIGASQPGSSGGQMA